MPHDSRSASPSAAQTATPLMKQYYDLKSQVDGALLFYRMGDFYELFDDDAIQASKLLEITLTSRDKNRPNPTPMAGVPYHSAQAYIQRLLDLGRKVAIAEQVVEMVEGKEVIRRELARVLTPGIQFESDSKQPHYLATVSESALSGARALAVLDASTGEVRSSVFANDDAWISHASTLPIRHLLWIDHERNPLPEALERWADAHTVLIEKTPKNRMSFDQAVETLKRQYGLASLGAQMGTPEEASCIALLVQTVLKTQKIERLPSLRFPKPLVEASHLKLGPQTARHLDLFPGESGQPNLYEFLNRTKCSLGARLLRRWMAAPLKEPAAIALRQARVRELAERPLSSERAREALSGMYDLERILGRIHTRLANPRDTHALGRTLEAAAKLPALLEGLPALAPIQKALESEIARVRPLFERILREQKDEPPFHDREGGIFQRGADAELDRLLDLSENGQRWLLDLETRERERTGIPSLKVRYNKVFGYYIEITTAHLKNAPADYQRKQTMVGAERFFTEELKRFEEEFLTSGQKQKALEQKLFQALLDAIRERTEGALAVAELVAEIDALCSLSQWVNEPGWAFPEIDDSLALEIEAGRHPMVDASLRGGFVPNDTRFDPENALVLLITGPNMGGKSTLMRQVALIVLLGQMGSPVPARSARWGACSSIYTRIGAQDAISQGQSTFMVEMSELSQILHHADARSLIVLDEIGRGTSTYDGMSVAWAALEHLHEHVRARTLFATHYHELTEIPSRMPRIRNLHLAVEGGRDRKLEDFRFLYELREGPASESFGIVVGQLAGLPKAVTDRAWKVLEELESRESRSGSTEQLSLFSFRETRDPKARSATREPSQEELWAREIAAWKLTEMTPLEVMTRLDAAQKRLPFTLP